MGSTSPTGRKILLVGGGTGIGLSATEQILSSSPTSLLVIFGLDISPSCHSLQTTHPSRFWLLQGDVTNAAARTEAINLAVAKMGGIDTLVYSAGIMAPIQKLSKVGMEEWKGAFEVNIFGALGMVQSALPHLHASSLKGRVIIISSGCDNRVTYSGWSAYCASKAALTRFTQLLAYEEPGLTVMGVYPKLTGTGMPGKALAGKYEGIMSKEDMERFTSLEVEPVEWCGVAVGKLAAADGDQEGFGGLKGGKGMEGAVMGYYDEWVGVD